jgi:hypothetical protein
MGFSIALSGMSSCCLLLAECPQFYCGEILQMLTCLRFCFSKDYQRRDHSIHILQCHAMKFSRNLTFIGIRTQYNFFRRYGICFCNRLFETNIFGLSAVLISCIVSELQKRPLPGLQLRIRFHNFDLPKIFFWSQA